MPDTSLILDIQAVVSFVIGFFALKKKLKKRLGKVRGVISKAWECGGGGFVLAGMAAPLLL